MADQIETAVRAVLSHPWGSGPWSAHAEHKYDIECAVCQGDVAAILTVAVPHIAENALHDAMVEQHDEVIGRLAVEAIDRERPKLIAMMEEIADQAMAKKTAAIRAEERAAIIVGIRAYFAPVDDPLHEDVRILCGRIERGEYSPASHQEEEADRG
ncbi:hypothetical protein [Sphaerimonospora thailandensis]|uniref:Uncharacterized protein n=1 Tax=Sphaerimonospora thailandensis TaxID=795644 RepID=A0A8J3VZP3_9ACTN|nr:hypothetical protein [Sphaerimonospora thailandensis]GIH70310.1 hypothetical protein Mth01_25630 [Sphaerimonospora thailandensis]